MVYNKYIKMNEYLFLQGLLFHVHLNPQSIPCCISRAQFNKLATLECTKQSHKAKRQKAAWHVLSKQHAVILPPSMCRMSKAASMLVD